MRAVTKVLSATKLLFMSQFCSLVQKLWLCLITSFYGLIKVLLILINSEVMIIQKIKNLNTSETNQYSSALRHY